MALVGWAGWIIAPYHGPDFLYHRTAGFVLRAPFADRIVVGDSRVELAPHDDAALYIGYSGATTRSLARLVGVLCHVSDAPIVVALGINDTKPHETNVAASAQALGRMAESCGAGRLHLAGIWPAEDDVGVGGTEFSNRVARQIDAVMLAQAGRGEIRFYPGTRNVRPHLGRRALHPGSFAPVHPLSQQTGGRMSARTPFVTPALSILLDLVRGIAALLVLGGHLSQTGFYTGPYPFSQTMQHNAVIVFFVLSGLVIAHSVMSKDYDLRTYAIARAARILPVALFAVVFGVGAFVLADALGAPATMQHAVYAELTVQSVVLPLLFLGESSFGTGPVWNPPYWSLTYEVWYYALFGAAVFLTGYRRIIALGVLALLAGWLVLLLLPIWWAGAFLARSTWGQDLLPLRAVQLALAGGIAIFASNALGTGISETVAPLAGVIGQPLKFSAYFLTDYLFAAGTCAIFIAARPFAAWVEPWLQRGKPAIAWLAGCSFTLYILHWPMISLLMAFGIGAGGNPVAFAALSGGIIGICALIARFTEYRSPHVRAWLTRVTAPGERIRATVA